MTRLWATDGTLTLGSPIQIAALDVVNSEPNPSYSATIGYYLTPFQGKILFAANVGNGVGGELWASDGTPGGTSIVKEILPGFEGSIDFGGRLQEFRGRIYFPANDGEHGIELWSTDGTAEGTRLLKDIHPGPGDSAPLLGLAGAAGLFFAANDGVHGHELWVTDGTPEGTRMVKDIDPGMGSGVYSTEYAELGGRIFFAANDGVHGLELWASDGSSEGTLLVKDIIPAYLTGAGNRLFFAANDGVHGHEL